MIEIRELIIRATIENSNRDKKEESVGRSNDSDQNDKKECCAETADMMLQIIKDKNER